MLWSSASTYEYSTDTSSPSSGSVAIGTCANALISGWNEEPEAQPKAFPFELPLAKAFPLPVLLDDQPSALARADAADFGWGGVPLDSGR